MSSIDKASCQVKESKANLENNFIKTKTGKAESQFEENNDINGNGETHLSAGKIFRSMHPDIDSQTLGKWPSLGHYMSHMLETENADATILLDTNSNRKWTGAELRAKMLNVASALIDRHGFKSGDSVCISYDHSDLSCILALGAICAGGFVACAYPKDPYPEVLYLARKVEPKLLFCHSRNLNWAQQLSDDLHYKVVGVRMDDDDISDAKTSTIETIDDYLNHDWTRAQCKDQIPVASTNTKYHIALVTMSSGTTGRPKVVPTTHWNCLTHLLTYNRRAKGLFCASSASLDYVSGRIIILGAIQVGYTAVIMNGFEPKTYLEVIEKYKINSIFLGAAAFYNLITYPELERHDISSVKVVFPMGAKITYIDELREFFSKHSHIKVVKQGYGTSEISGGAGKDMTPEEYLIEPNNSGKLYPSVQAKIIDPQSGKLLGMNQEGLLLIKSNAVFPGYFDLEAARAIRDGKPTKFVSAEAFNLFDDEAPSAKRTSSDDLWPLVCEPETFDENGFYKTGDLAYFTSDEELFIVGRYNEMMSCRCARKVIPQELEEILLEHPSVLKVCVFGVAHKHEPGLHCPRAFVVPKTNDQVELTGAHFEPEEEEDKNLQFKGANKLSKMSDGLRRQLAVDLMNHVNVQVAWEKHLTGGIVILDDIPVAKSNGKMDKGFLRSLTLKQIEIYGDRSE